MKNLFSILGGIAGVIYMVIEFGYLGAVLGFAWLADEKKAK